MSGIRTTFCLVLAAVALALASADAQAPKKQLVVALNQDPDILDPTLSRTYVGRIIFAQICEKLYEIDEGLNIQPQLAAALPAVSDGGKTVTIKLRPGVKFNDGTPCTAEAMKFSLDRHREMKGSNRRSELESVTAVEVVDPLTVRLRLKAPFSPLTAQLADRAGMPISPAADKKLGDKFGTAPVCVGPWQFVERVAQDRIVVERSPALLRSVGGEVRPDRLPDHPRRQRAAGQPALRRHRRHAPGGARPTPPASRRKAASRSPASPASASTRSRSTCTTRPARRTRPATSARRWPTTRGCARRSSCRSTARRSTRSPTRARTRSAAGRSRPTAPSSTRRASASTRDVARAKKLLADAGLAERLQVRDGHRQQPAAAAGGRGHPGHGHARPDSTSACGPQEFASALKDNDDGKHQSFLIGWSGRVDPDGNIHQGQACGGSLNATAGLRREGRRAPEQGARGHRHRPAPGALPRGHRPDRRAPQHHLPLPPELHRGVPQEPQGLQGGARRADPDQGDRLAVARRVRVSRPPGLHLGASRCCSSA